MPFFATEITIPASTTWTAPKEETLPIDSGRVVGWYIQGAPEHQHQVQLAIYYREHRVFPEGEKMVFYPSEFPFAPPEDLRITADQTFLTLKGTNDDDTYEHTVYVGAVVDVEEAPKDVPIDTGTLLGLAPGQVGAVITPLEVLGL
jgi:hypothetical protein